MSFEKIPEERFTEMVKTLQMTLGRFLNETELSLVRLAYLHGATAALAAIGEKNKEEKL